MPLWEELTMEEFQQLVERGALFVLPLGSLEGHGTHLPLGTDIIQPMHVLKILEEEIPLIIAPPILYGHCGSTGGLPGSLSISTETLKKLVEEVLQGFVRAGARRILVLSGHAGRSHMCAIREACQHIVNRWPDVVLWCLSDYDILYRDQEMFKEVPSDDGHGGMMETSRVMAIRGDLVKLERLKGVSGSYPGDYRVKPRPWEDLPYGFVGYPEKASVELGEKLNRHIAIQLLKLLK
ncbi:MAG: creatininase family protein [Thermoplasmata archaeon]|nr:creatininase family protein [Thermoplasmata archaeon]